MRTVGKYHVCRRWPRRRILVHLGGAPKHVRPKLGRIKTLERPSRRGFPPNDAEDETAAPARTLGCLRYFLFPGWAAALRAPASSPPESEKSSVPRRRSSPVGRGTGDGGCRACWIETPLALAISRCNFYTTASARHASASASPRSSLAAGVICPDVASNATGTVHVPGDDHASRSRHPYDRSNVSARAGPERERAKMALVLTGPPR